MSQFGDPANDLAKDLSGIDMPSHDDRKHYMRLACKIATAHALGTRKENQIGSKTFSKKDQDRVVAALMFAARHGVK